MFLICFLFVQCDSTEPLTASSPKAYFTSEQVPINVVLDSFTNKTILSQTKNFSTSIGIQENSSKQSSKNTNVYFTKIQKGNEYSTYLLLLNKYSNSKPYFMYYVMTIRDKVEKAGFVKYIPDVPMVSLDQKNFTGKIELLDTNLKKRSEGKFVNGQLQKNSTATTSKMADNCTSTTTIIPHNCGYAGDHSPDTACDDGNYYSYYEILTTTTCPFTSGYDNSAPLPNEFINTNDGGGSGGGANANIEILNFEMIYLDANQKMWWDNPDNLADKQIFMDYLNQNPTDEAKQIVSEMITQMNGGRFAPKFDVKASLYSPMNIITSTIDTTTIEGKKFTEVYGALLTSPSFKELFVDIFKDSKRDNVEFEINDKVFKDNDPTKKEVNATTSFDPISKNIVIKINKKILIAGTTLSQTKIENAKTILHECIHAYLFSKANYPNTGVDFVNILNSMYPTSEEQHDFMYTKMIPAMTNVLGDIRDMVTSDAGRAEVMQRIMFPTIIPQTRSPWNWNDYYKYLSMNGLEEAECFKVDFPKDTDQWKLLAKYIEYGHNDLRF